ncbi:MAG TPA: putative Ig domain-containing protein [Candidatus Dormibacteraeota bacterium]|nr:putative Ig domain-containing protein [Candidatus Dormibacteraeota bacterium]
MTLNSNFHDTAIPFTLGVKLKVRLPLNLCRGLGKAILTFAMATLMGCSNTVSPGNSAVNPRSKTLQITTAALPVGTVQSSYAATLTAAGGTTPYAWSLTSGALPAGLTLDNLTGTISGTPKRTVTSALLTFKLTDSSNPPLSQTANLALTVSPAALVITTTSLPNGQVGSAYGATLDATGGVAPYSWSTTSGNLPPGITLNPATGTIEGTATSSGTFAFTAKVQDARASSASSSFSVNVSAAPALTVSAISPNSGSTTGGTSVTISGNNFRPGVLVQFGSLPSPSVQVVNSTQIRALTPTGPSGTVSVKVQNFDGQSASASNAFTFVAPPAPSPTPPALSADVVVDASQAVSETGVDDLAAVKNIYSSASAPESNGGLSDWDLISSEFAMKRMRNINGLGDCALDANGNLTGCSRLNNDLAHIKVRNLTPHVVVGQWAPLFIGGNPLQWGATQWAKYDALSYAIVNYVANQYGGTGFSEVLFEVENEMDTTTNAQDLWLTTISGVPQGDPSRFTQFDTVYSHWANAVNLVAHQNPNKKIRIAGPSTGFWTIYYGSGQLWHNQIIKKNATQGIRLDVASLHVYGGEANDLAKYAQSIRDTLIASGNLQAEIWVTEWGASSSGDRYFGGINASHQGAAWAIYFLLQALKGTVTGGSFLEVRDNRGSDTAGVNSNIYAASWNHVEKSVEYPKAIANAFSMVDRMIGTRKSVAVNPTKPDLYALASSSSSSASVIVANHSYLFDWTHKNFSDQTTVENVTVAFKNLPFNGPVTVDRYHIDAQTSNLNYWISVGKTPPSVLSTQLQKVESFSAAVTGGSLTLPMRQFGQSAVSLYIVHQ